MADESRSAAMPSESDGERTGRPCLHGRAGPSASMRPLFLSFSLLVTLVALSGCADGADHDGTCPERSDLGRVASIDGTSVAVQVLVPVDDYVILDTAGADFHYYAGSSDSCHEASRDDLQAGQEIEFHVDAWADSEPPQAKVDDIVIRG